MTDPALHCDHSVRSTIHKVPEVQISVSYRATALCSIGSNHLFRAWTVLTTGMKPELDNISTSQNLHVIEFVALVPHICWTEFTFHRGQDLERKVSV